MQARAQWADVQSRAREPGSSVLQTWLAGRQGGAERAGIQASDARYVLTDREAMADIFQTRSLAGPPVTASTAMQVTTVYACIALIAGAISSLPLNFFERTDSVGGRKRISHDLWWLFNEQPTPLMAAAVFWEYILATRFLHGDGFALLIRNRAGAIVEVLPLSPLEVDVKRMDKQLFYTVNSPDLGKPFGVYQDDMLHFMGFGFNLRTGRSLSIIRHIARQVIGTALATDEFSARFFSQGAQPSHVIRFPGPVKEEQINALRLRWEERQAGLGNSHKPLVLTNNADVKELSLKPADAQLLETKRFSVEDICRPFGVPPFMVGQTDKVTSFGSGVEHMGQAFVRFTLARHLGPCEQEINRKAFRTAKVFCEFNLDGLQRGDLKTRGEYYRQAMGGAQGPGWLTVNDIRSKENEEPLPDGNKLFDPSQVKPANPDTPPAQTESAA